MQQIGLDARLPAYHQGGITTWIREVLQCFQSMEVGHSLTVFESHRAKSSVAGRFDRATLFTPCHHRLESLALSAELLPRRLDLLHSPDFIPPLRGARRHVITIHDLHFLHFPQFQTRASRRYYNGQIRRAVRQADHVITVSCAARRDIIEMLNVPADRITVQHHGVNRCFRPMPQSALQEQRRKLDLPAEFFLFVGTFEPRKNIAGLLESWRRLREQLPDAPPVVLAGRKGWLFDETMQSIRDMRLGEQVIWRENVPQAALPALYNLASALILPSFHEGFGFPALEAMACGTVPVVSDVSSLPEVVGDTGLRVDPNDPDALAAAMQQVLVDSTWLEEQKTAVLQRAALFTWDKSARILLNAWQQVLADG